MSRSIEKRGLLKETEIEGTGGGAIRYDDSSEYRVSASATSSRAIPSSTPYDSDIGRPRKSVMKSKMMSVLSNPQATNEEGIPRWTGGPPTAIGTKLIQQCTTGKCGEQVTDLNFHFKFISRIAGLSEKSICKNLQTLDLSSNNIKCIEGLNGMIRLEELRLCGCEIQRIGNLHFCTRLTSLYLQDNRIAAIEGLEYLRSLEYLNLDSNRIEVVGRGFQGLSKLRELHLSFNRLTSLAGVSCLASLETLSASGNNLQTVPALHFNGLEKLDELRLASTKLQNLQFLTKPGKNGSLRPSLPRLVSLDVGSNALTTSALKEIPRMQHLADLDLCSNAISEFPEELVSKIPAIEILDLSRNKLESLEGLEQLQHATSLRELSLHSNPITPSLNATGFNNSAALGSSKPTIFGLAGSKAQPNSSGTGLGYSKTGFNSSKGLNASSKSILNASGNAIGGTCLNSSRTGQGSFSNSKSFNATLSAEDLLKRLLAKLPSLQLLDGRPLPKIPTSPNQTAGSNEMGDTFRLTSTFSRKEPLLPEPELEDELPRMKKHRFAGEDQVKKWEHRAMQEFASIAKDVDRIGLQAKSGLEDMDSFLQHCRGVLDRELELTRPGLTALLKEPVLRKPRLTVGQGLADSNIDRFLKEGVSDDSADDEDGDFTPSQGSGLRHPPVASSRHVLSGVQKQRVTFKEQSRCLNKLSRQTDGEPSVYKKTPITENKRAEPRRGLPSVIREGGEVDEEVPEELDIQHENPSYIGVLALEDMTEVEENIEVSTDKLGNKVEIETEQLHDNRDVKEASSRLRSVRALKKNRDLCHSRSEHSQKSASSLPPMRPIPFPVLHSSPSLLSSN